MAMVVAFVFVVTVVLVLAVIFSSSLCYCDKLIVKSEEHSSK